MLIVVVVDVAVAVIDECAVVVVDIVASTSNITLQKSTVFLFTTYFLFISSSSSYKCTEDTIMYESNVQYHYDDMLNYYNRYLPQP